MPAWIEHAVFWHLYPFGFTGAPIRPQTAPPLEHRLGHLTGWLDYAVELGASALLLGPIFASATHGYDTIDHFRIDPRLGDEADFDRLIEQARARGLRVVLDGVFNHVGRSHPFVRDVLEHGGSSPKASWFRYTPEGELVTFEGHHGLVALNGANPEVEAYVRTVMCHWLDRGASGWRLDAAYAMAPDFWARVLPGVRERHPDAFIFAELIRGDYAGFVRASGVDSVTQYELWKAIWSALNDRNFFELSWALDRHNGFLDRVVRVSATVRLLRLAEGRRGFTRFAHSLSAARASNRIRILCGRFLPGRSGHSCSSAGSGKPPAGSGGWRASERPTG